MYYFLVFHGQYGLANALQCYIMRILPVLLFLAVVGKTEDWTEMQQKLSEFNTQLFYTKT
jgi:hypothetical protein